MTNPKVDQLTVLGVDQLTILRVDELANHRIVLKASLRIDKLAMLTLSQMGHGQSCLCDNQAPLVSLVLENRGLTELPELPSVLEGGWRGGQLHQGDHLLLAGRVMALLHHERLLHGMVNRLHQGLVNMLLASWLHQCRLVPLLWTVPSSTRLAWSGRGSR